MLLCTGLICLRPECPCSLQAARLYFHGEGEQPAWKAEEERTKGSWRNGFGGKTR